MIRTKEQNKRFHTLLTLRKLDREEKQALVVDCSGGRVSSSADMTVAEMALAITILDSEQTSSLKKMRAKIIHIARDIFGMAPTDEWKQTHYDRLNEFLQKTFKCHLHKLPYQKLPDAVTATEKWRDWKTKQLVKDLLNAV